MSGFMGEQFGLPIAVESLRAMRTDSLPGELLTISAADPLNLTGILLPGDRISSVSGKTITLRDGIYSEVDEVASGFSADLAV